MRHTEQCASDKVESTNDTVVRVLLKRWCSRLDVVHQNPPDQNRDDVSLPVTWLEIPCGMKILWVDIQWAPTIC